MSSPQGKTGTILGQIRSPDGRLFYVKKNPNAQLTDIEFRIYQNACQELGEVYPIPQVFLGRDNTILVVEDVGTSLETILHRPEELQQTRESFTDFLEQNLNVRLALNKVINKTLTLEDQQFLMRYNRDRLVSSIKKIMPEEKGMSLEDLEQDIELHFWAYRVMNAIGVYDEEFKLAYTRVIGSKIDGLVAEGGTWLQDNCLRNNASPDGKILIPFDFNSLQYGLPQMDEAGMSGMYLFNGILGVYDTPEERNAFIASRARAMGESVGSDSDEKFWQGYILSVVHQNALLAGYRTQEAKRLCDEVLDQKAKGDPSVVDTDNAYRSAFDEVEYQHSAAVEPLRVWNGCREAFGLDVEKDIQYVDGFITHHTFGQRIGMMMRLMRR